VSAKLPGGSDEPSVMTDNIFSIVNPYARNNVKQCVPLNIEMMQDNETLEPNRKSSE